MATAPKHLRDLDAFEQDYANSRTEYAALYDANGDLVVARHGGEKSVEFTPEELARAKGGVLSHDHPHGHDLSSADVALAVQHGLEVRATGHTPGGFKTYSVRSPKAYEDTSPLIQFYEKAYQQEKAAGRDPYAAREATVARTARRFGLERRVFNRNDIVHEGLETEEQRAWWFWHLKDEGGYESPEKAKPESPFEKVRKQHEAIGKSIDQAKTASLGSKAFNKPMATVAYEKLASQHELDYNHGRKSVEDYSGSSYRDINGVLRTGKYESESGYQYPQYLKDKIDKQIADIKGAIDSYSLPQDTSVYRGFSEKRFPDLKVGSTIEDKGFVSTSILVNKAKDFFKPGPNGSLNNSKIFQLDLPKDHPALAIRNMSQSPGENEILLNPQSFKVTKIETKDTGTFYGEKTLTIYHLSPTGNGKSK